MRFSIEQQNERTKKKYMYPKLEPKAIDIIHIKINSHMLIYVLLFLFLSLRFRVYHPMGWQRYDVITSQSLTRIRWEHFYFYTTQIKVSKKNKRWARYSHRINSRSDIFIALNGTLTMAMATVTLMWTRAMFNSHLFTMSVWLCTSVK